MCLLEHSRVHTELLIHCDEHLECLSTDLKILGIHSASQSTLYFGDVKQLRQLLSLNLKEIAHLLHVFLNVGVEGNQGFVVALHSFDYRVYEELIIISQKRCCLLGLHTERLA